MQDLLSVKKSWGTSSVAAASPESNNYKPLTQWIENGPSLFSRENPYYPPLPNFYGSIPDAAPDVLSCNFLLYVHKIARITPVRAHKKFINPNSPLSTLFIIANANSSLGTQTLRPIPSYFEIDLRNLVMGYKEPSAEDWFRQYI